MPPDGEDEVEGEAFQHTDFALICKIYADRLQYWI